MKAKYHAIKQKTMKNNTIIYTAISLDNYIYIYISELKIQEKISLTNLIVKLNLMIIGRISYIYMCIYICICIYILYLYFPRSAEWMIGDAYSYTSP